MASLNALEKDGLAGFDPEWDDYTGRAYQWRTKARQRTWCIGLCFARARDCEYLPSLVSAVGWHKAITRNLREGDDEISVEITYKDYQDGKPIGRLAVLKGTRYPIATRFVRGEKRPSVLWSKGTTYENKERHLAPTKTELLDATIGMAVEWYVFEWSGDGWEHVASVTSAEHKDAFVSLLKRQGKEVYVAKRDRERRVY